MHRRHSLSGRLAALLLTLLFVLVHAYAAEAAASFSDVSADAWYAEAVQYVWEQGWMTGTDAAAFSPDLVMTRGMLVTVLYRAAGSPALEDENLGYPFTDVPGSAWYADGVYWARLTGIADGYGNNLFGPDDPVTREQLVTLRWRWSGQPDTADGSQFDDEGDISSWAADAVDWASASGLVSGKPGNRFDPGGQATRAEAAVLLTRWHTLQSEEETPDDSLPDDSESSETEEQPEVSTDTESPDSDDSDDRDDTEQTASDSLLNRYDSSAFTLENGYLIYQSDTPCYIGVDVSSHQGEIDWERVADAGIDFAMIRVGYRGYTVGRIQMDSYFESNIRQALAAGLEVGVYFFSQATNLEEAQEEALQTLAWIEDYPITYPVVFDWERISSASSRTSDTPDVMVTACAMAFCETIESAGYTAMIYGNPSMVGSELDLSQLSEYAFWLAHYTSGWQPTSFAYHYDMWQYTSYGSVDGISTRVDLNLCLTDW